MRYLMALMLVWGVCQFSSAQVEQNLDEDCPPTSKNEGQTDNNGVDMDVETDTDADADADLNLEDEADADADVNLDDDAYVRENEVEIESDELDTKSEEDLGTEGKTNIEIETEGDTEIDIESDESDAAEFEMQPADSMPMQDQSKECPDVDAGTTSEVTSQPTTYETTNVMVVEEEKERSTAGKVLVAPVKFVGNIPKAVFSIGSETVEGAAHIVGAPFKGIGKLFGAGDDDDDKDEINVDI